jgi:ABC-2 type transport system permease protein
MVINDFTWVVFWLLVFHRRRSISGWNQHDVLVLFALLTFSVGAGVGIFNGVRRMSWTIRTGGLDPWLAQPAPVLVRVLFQRVDPALMGDLVFGPLLFALTGVTSPLEWLRFAVMAVLAALMISAYLVIIESAAFWLRGGGEMANIAFGAITVVNSYPANIYGGVVKLLVYTALPAAFMTSIPARFVLQAGAGRLAEVAAATVVLCAGAVLVFNAGLRRYVRGAMV